MSQMINETGKPQVTKMVADDLRCQEEVHCLDNNLDVIMGEMLDIVVAHRLKMDVYYLVDELMSQVARELTQETKAKAEIVEPKKPKYIPKCTPGKPFEEPPPPTTPKEIFMAHLYTVLTVVFYVTCILYLLPLDPEQYPLIKKNCGFKVIAAYVVLFIYNMIINF